MFPKKVFNPSFLEFTDDEKEKEKEKEAAAAQETLRVVRSPTSRTGYKGVSMQDGKYVARIAVKGRMRYLGSFATALEAATRYASEIGEERAAVEAAEVNVVVQPPLRHESTRVHWIHGVRWT